MWICETLTPLPSNSDTNSWSRESWVKNSIGGLTYVVLSKETRSLMSVKRQDRTRSEKKLRSTDYTRNEVVHKKTIKMYSKK